MKEGVKYIMSMTELTPLGLRLHADAWPAAG